MLWNFPSPGCRNTSKGPVSTISSPSVDEETLADLAAGNRSEHARSNSWTGSQFSAGGDNASTVTSVRRRPSIFPVAPVTRDSDSETHNLVTKCRLSNSNEGGLASTGTFGTLRPLQRTQNLTFESTQETLKTSSDSRLPSYWRIFGLKNTCARFFRPRLAAESRRIEWTCVSINRKSLYSERVSG
jgi:hypothetical protein